MATYTYPSISIAPTVGAATEAKQDAIITELQLKADLTETQPVSVSTLPLPTGAATETTLAALAAEDFATQTTLAALEAKNFSTEVTSAAILAELALKADLTETQPVSLASSPLPSGAATESTVATLATQATLAALLTELQLKADLLETQPVSTASLPLPSGASTEATVATLATQTTSAAILAELALKADLTETQPVSAASLPLPSGAATESTVATLSTAANQTTTNASLSSIESDMTALNARLAGNLVPETFDYLALTYVAAGNGIGEIDTVVYKTSGAAGTVVATLTLGYDASNKLSSVTRS